MVTFHSAEGQRESNQSDLVSLRPCERGPTRQYKELSFRCKHQEGLNAAFRCL